MEPLSPSRIVRFDTECVLIPDAQPAGKLPFVLTKSYSLPLWRKDDEDESRLVIKVPIPQFRRRASRSPGPHARAASTSPVVPRAPLPSCLVHQHQDPGPSAAPLSPVRRPAPGPSSPSPLTSPPPLTVPLRPCCAACEAATDDALAGGEAWKIHFTRGAKRRRSASLEQPPSTVASPFAALADVDAPVRTFAALSAAIDGTLPIVRGGAAVATAFALRVDEVDQRRRAFSFSHEEEHYAALRRHAGSPPPHAPPIVPLASSAAAISPSPVSPIPVHPYASLLAPEGYRLRASPIAEEDSDARGSSLSLASAQSSTRSASGQSTRSTGSGSIRALGKGRAPRRVNTAVAPPPGADEDDADLFPLPRRSPSGTPSPRGSPILGSSGGYFASPSPSASSSSLAVPSSEMRRAAMPEVESKDAGAGVLGPSLSRRVGTALRIHTASVIPAVLPPTPRTTTTAKSTARPTITTETTAPSTPPPVPIPPTPILSPVRRPTSPRGPRAPVAPPLPSASPSGTPETPTPRVSRHTHTQSTGPSTSRSKSPRPSPNTGAAHEHRRAHSIAAALRGAGADVLRGVGGLGGVGVGSV